MNLLNHVRATPMADRVLHTIPREEMCTTASKICRKRVHACSSDNVPSDISSKSLRSSANVFVVDLPRVMFVAQQIPIMNSANDLEY
jgi:hypothetical protein